PALDPSVIRACRDRAVPCMPGAFTPTELLAAWRAGALVVKLFPASAVGPGYIRDVLAPLPFLRLVPSGGVSLENVGDWIRAGAGRPAGAGLVGGADGARPVVRRARRGGPAPPGQDAMTRVVTFGELLLRLSPPGEERLFESSDLVTCFGGAEANVAVALSHFGVRCDYVTRVPDNPIGHAGVAALEREGVGTEWIQRGGERLGIYFVEPGADLRSMRG